MNDASERPASARARRTWRITRPERGRRARYGCGETGGSDAALLPVAVVLPVIHSFAGGTGVAVYCSRAVREYSHFLGAQTPINTRHAAATRFMLEKKRQLSRGGREVMLFEKRKRTARNYLKHVGQLKQEDDALRLIDSPLISLL
jgi:hypothetical protein